MIAEQNLEPDKRHTWCFEGWSCLLRLPVKIGVSVSKKEDVMRATETDVRQLNLSAEETKTN